MTGLEVLALAALFALFLVLPIGTYLGVDGDATNANQYVKFIETHNTESDI